jgi:hypothetical protein
LSTITAEKIFGVAATVVLACLNVSPGYVHALNKLFGAVVEFRKDMRVQVNQAGGVMV